MINQVLRIIFGDEFHAFFTFDLLLLPAALTFGAVDRLGARFGAAAAARSPVSWPAWRSRPFGAHSPAPRSRTSSGARRWGDAVEGMVNALVGCLETREAVIGQLGAATGLSSRS